MKIVWNTLQNICLTQRDLDAAISALITDSLIGFDIAGTAADWPAKQVTTACPASSDLLHMVYTWPSQHAFAMITRSWVLRDNALHLPPGLIYALDNATNFMKQLLAFI